MDRLTKRFSNGQAAVAGCGSNCKYDYKYCSEEIGACPTLSAVYEALARYEEAEEQGQIMRGVHMTNFEKYRDKILEIARETEYYLAIKNGAPVRCKDVPGCSDCEIERGDCCTNFIEWFYEDDGKQELTCSSCKHTDKREDEYPCSECSRGYTDLFERKAEKTRQSKFLELFPNATVIDGVLDIMPCSVAGREFEEQNCDSYVHCRLCRKDYWLKEVEE